MIAPKAPHLRRSFFLGTAFLGLWSVVPGCRDDIAAIDAQTDTLMRDRTDRLGGGAISPTRARPRPDGLDSPRLTQHEPSSTNPAAEDLRYSAADEARDVQARLGEYAEQARENATVIDLRAAFRQAQISGREYLTAEEDYILAAIRLLIERHLWSPRFFATSTAEISTVSPAATDQSNAALSVINELRVTQRLPYGGEVEARYIFALTEQLREAASGAYQPSNQLVLSANIPLLRGAGDVAREDLIQAERDLVYAARTFENFRRSFLVDIAGDYFDLVRQRAEIGNSERALKLLRDLEERTKALVAAGRVAEFERNIAASDVLRGTSQLANLRERYILAVDRFKVRLGLPVDMNIEISPVDIGLPDPATTPEIATGVALDYRLDLQTQRDRVDDSRRGINNAQNNLLPDLNLTGDVNLNANSGTGRDWYLKNPSDSRVAGGVTFGLPLDREIERLNLRSAAIRLDQARRALDLLRDNIIVEVRSRVRDTDRARFNLELQQQAVYINQRRAEEQEIKKDEVTAQQVVETAQALQNAENSRDQAVSDLRNAVLNYLLSTGQLRVARDGTLQPLAGMDTSPMQLKPYTPPGTLPPASAPVP